MLFREKNLWVKWGSRTRLSEGQSIYIVRTFLADQFPLPELYGWRTDGDDVFLYCEWLRGQTLEQAWDTMEVDNRLAISHELGVAFSNLRRLYQDPNEQFIGESTQVVSTTSSFVPINSL